MESLAFRAHQIKNLLESHPPNSRFRGLTVLRWLASNGVWGVRAQPDDRREQQVIMIIIIVIMIIIGSIIITIIIIVIVIVIIIIIIISSSSSTQRAPRGPVDEMHVFQKGVLA